MIIVQLKGGLGNQMFQYAAGLSLAAHHNVPLRVDVSELGQADKAIGTLRHFDLQQVILEPVPATESELAAATKQNVFSKGIDKLKAPFRRKVYKEKDFYFDPHFFKAGDDVYLKGYRQSESYFAPIRDKVACGFQVKPTTVAGVEERGLQIKQENSVAVHIRRGDFTNKVVSDYHGMLDAAYYQQAIAAIEAKIDDARFYVFSDDPQWMKEQLFFASPVEIMSGVVSKNQFEDFYLISQCKHQIIANSTFSWWAAWLNSNPGKIVIAPKKWFNNAPYDTRDLIPEGWIKI
jgi:hypothetical protein